MVLCLGFVAIVLHSVYMGIHPFLFSSAFQDIPPFQILAHTTRCMNNLQSLPRSPPHPAQVLLRRKPPLSSLILLGIPVRFLDVSERVEYVLYQVTMQPPPVIVQSSVNNFQDAVLRVENPRVMSELS